MFGCKKSLERHLGFSERNMFSMKECIYFIVLTNTHVEGEMGKKTFIEEGHSVLNIQVLSCKDKVYARNK